MAIVDTSKRISELELWASTQSFSNPTRSRSSINALVKLEANLERLEQRSQERVADLSETKENLI
jgi:hypothetical protein